MRLQRLTGLERQKIVDEYTETLKLIARLREILANERLVYGIMVEELREIRQAYGDARRTEIVPAAGEISIEDMIAEEEMVITVSHAGYMKRNPLSTYRSQRRGGKGKIGMTTREEDFVEHLFVASTHASILIFTTRGRDVLTSPVVQIDRPEQRYLESYTWRTRAGEILVAAA
jgi:DNA gyrase subunit A